MGDRRTWTLGLTLGLAVLFAAGIGVRLWMWPEPGLVGDLDQFVLWVHGIAVDGWARAYDQDLSFPAVMAWVWGALAAVEPAFRTVTDSSDPAIRALMKVPASIADLAIAGAVWWWFRDRPRLALLGVGAVLLWPVTWYVSAWWGQYEPIYVLPAVLALLAARAGRPGLVAALLAISLMTKPQALPLIVPFAAWFLATQGWRGTLRAAVIGALVVVVPPGCRSSRPVGRRTTWATSRPTRTTSSASCRSGRGTRGGCCRSWGRGGSFVSDTTAVLGPLTFRHLGFVLAGLLGIAVFAGVYRRPTPEQLALGLAAISLVAFVSLTTMHERYAYPAFVFLLLAMPRPVVAITWVAFAVVFALNLVVAVPPAGWVIPRGAADRDRGGRRDDGDRDRDDRRGGAGDAGPRAHGPGRPALPYLL